MPPPENPRPKPEPKPKPKRPKPKPKELRTDPMPARPPWKRPERDGTPVLPAGDVAALHPPPFSCETYPLCPPPRPEAPPAAVHLRSGRIPTPLVAVSASLLALSAVLLLALLARYLVRRRRRRGQQEAAALAQGDNDEESVLGVDSTTAGGVGAVEEEEDVETGDGGVHHVWYIRTKGLDERAIAAIAAVVYDAKTNHGAAGAGANTDGGCAVCLAEFRDGETLRLLPRCGHAFHRGCIDTWLRAHVNCPLCRAPVQAPAAGANSTGATALSLREEEASEASVTGARTEEAVPNVLAAEHAVRRAASMMALPRRAWPDASLPAPASTSARQEEMTGLGKVRMLLKFSGTMDNLAGVGAGRSASFGAGRPVLSSTLPTRSGMSTATGVNGDESR